MSVKHSALYTFIILLGAFSIDSTAETKKPKLVDAKNVKTGNAKPYEDPGLAQFGRYAADAPRPSSTSAAITSLPLKIDSPVRITLIGNTLFDRANDYGYFEAYLHQKFATRKLVVRNLAWAADEVDLQPRADNFADLEQQLTVEKADIIFAAFGFNESFGGPEKAASFRARLTRFIERLQTSAFNGRHAPQIVIVSPIANEDLPAVEAASRNNENIELYTRVMADVAKTLKVGFADVFHPMQQAIADSEPALTINGIHLNDRGYRKFAQILFEKTFFEPVPSLNEALREAVVEKNRQYFRRYRPLNTFYYTGGRNKSYGYLDFLPAMRSFDKMVENRDQRIWHLAQGKKVNTHIDDSNVPEMPDTAKSRGANEWLSPEDELKAFTIDPRFDVNLFASEIEFPDIACPIQMRWDAKGRLWVSCSTTYPHVYPGQEPVDKIVILEDLDQDGRADKSTVFADDLHIPLSFEMDHTGVYVSEMPHLTRLKDTDGDDRADEREILLSGFGVEDSHHAIHDFVWTPDGDLMFRESIFHHSQIETPYGPVRAKNSSWFRFRPDKHHLTAFGAYPNTNPWGVTFDDWGHHVASHPIFASAFHATNPPYPEQHPRAAGIPAYSGVCGHEFVDFSSWPEELQGGFIKVRYKPSNRVEIHTWEEEEDHFKESYKADLIFSSNLSFIPTDLRYGPRGAMYVCDWYNPIKGHAQYSLRDDRRDRKSGRIWRIVPKGATLQDPPKIADAELPVLLENLKRPEYRYRHWSKRELRSRSPEDVTNALNQWVRSLSPSDTRYRHHQLEALWTYRNVGSINIPLLKEMLNCENHLARAAATRQLRYWHPFVDDAVEQLESRAKDQNAIVRMEAANTATYYGTKEAFEAILAIQSHPMGNHLGYAFRCALGAESIRRHWEKDPQYTYLNSFLQSGARANEFAEPEVNATEAQYDRQPNLKTVRISCIPERMKFTAEQFTVEADQPLKLVFINPDATDHNLVITKPGALEEVGMAANEMAKDPKNANSDFVPTSKKNLILQHTPMIGPTRRSKVAVLRFQAPREPGIYPYVCTFPGHWVVMNGEMIVTSDSVSEASLLSSKPQRAFIKNWTLADIESDLAKLDQHSAMKGMKAFAEARCDQCHKMAGHGVNLGPDLSEIGKKYPPKEILKHILDPSRQIDDTYRLWQFELKDGSTAFGSIVEESRSKITIRPNLLAPEETTVLPKNRLSKRTPQTQSAMPEGMLSLLEKDEILDLLRFLQVGHDH